MDGDKLFCGAFVAVFIIVFGIILINDYTSGERKLKCIKQLSARQPARVDVRLSERLGHATTPPNVGTTQGEPTGWPLTTEAHGVGRIGAI